MRNLSPASSVRGISLKTPFLPRRYFFGSSNSGKTFNPKNAVQMSTVYACVRVIAETIACLAELSRKKLRRSQGTSGIYIDSYRAYRTGNSQHLCQTLEYRSILPKL